MAEQTSTDATAACDPDVARLLLDAVNAARSMRQTLEGVVADHGLELEDEDQDAAARASEAEEAGMAWLNANAPKCPGCRQAFAFQRQERRPSHCSWCGYNHDSYAESVR